MTQTAFHKVDPRFLVSGPRGFCDLGNAGFLARGFPRSLLFAPMSLYVILGTPGAFDFQAFWESTRKALDLLVPLTEG